jgi:hypothetical protein
LKRPGLSERIPLGDQENAVGRIPAAVAIPAELQSFSESLLLPDESFRDFEFQRNAIAREVRPESFIEWLWTFDLVELSWVILRYRRFKMRLLDAIAPLRLDRFCFFWMARGCQMKRRQCYACIQKRRGQSGATIPRLRPRLKRASQGVGSIKAISAPKLLFRHGSYF